jgi:hypothetical protein
VFDKSKQDHHNEFQSQSITQALMQRVTEMRKHNLFMWKPQSVKKTNDWKSENDTLLDTINKYMFRFCFDMQQDAKLLA